MAINSGVMLGPYEIVSSLGAGGMGEVYRARDTRLGRTVAIKVLPSDFWQDPVRANRFEQEARAVAALSHPNILALYDVGRAAPSDASEPVSYFVTELVEGRSLRQLLSDESLSLPRIIDIATAMAEGLAAAHAQGIVHRDVKPENIIVSNDGLVKLLDFGLAKTAPSTADISQAPTRFVATTEAVAMGTPGYMSPEQARGQVADSRTDVFSFGAVLYELIGGKPAFTGATTVDLLSATLRDAPAPMRSTPDRPVPPALALIVERCLEKTPAARFQSTKDLAFALKTLSHADLTVSPSGTRPGTAPFINVQAPAAPTPPGSPAVSTPLSVPAMTTPASSSARGAWWGIGGAVLATAATLAIWQPWKKTSVAPAPPTTPVVAAPTETKPSAPATPPPATPTPAQAPATVGAPAPATGASAALSASPSAPASTSAAPQVQRLAVALTDVQLFMGINATSSPPFALSSDGSRLVYVGMDKGRVNPALYLRPINQFQSTRLAGTDGASSPFFSADGRSIGFFADKALKKMPIGGGAPDTVATIATRVAGGISWGPDNTIVYGTPLFRVPASGGAPDDLHQAGQAPQALPGGAVLFTDIAPGQPPRASVRLPNGTVKELVRNAMNPRYVAPGYLIYAERNTLFAMKFDLKKFEISGSPIQMIDEVQGSTQGWSAFSVSTNGSLAYLPGAMATASSGRLLTWINRDDGHETPWALTPQLYADVLVSPDDALVLTLLAEDAVQPGGRRTPARQAQPLGRNGRANIPGGPDDPRRLWVGDAVKKTLIPLSDFAPTAFAWWPDSHRVIYAKGDGSLYWRKVDGASAEEQLRPAGCVSILPGQLDVAPDGKSIIWAGRAPGDAVGRTGLWTMTGIDVNATGGGAALQIQKIVDPPNGNITTPRISPDGRTLALMIVRQGHATLTIRPVVGPGPAIEVSTDTNGAAPEWHGRQLVWRRVGASGVEIMSADIPAVPRPQIGPISMLFAMPPSGANLLQAFQLSRDGKRLLATRGDTPVAPSQINLILNWVEELKQRVK